MPRIYKTKNEYYYKITAYGDMETCEIENKEYNQTNKPTYSDIPESMFTIMCSMIIDFVEKEEPIKMIDWDWDEGQSKCRDEFMKLYRFAKAWPKYQHRIEMLYLNNEWCGGGIYDIWFVYEDKLLQLQDQFMRRLIDIRMGLWT